MQDRNVIIRSIRIRRKKFKLKPNTIGSRLRLPDKTEERSVQIYIPYERTFSLVF